jgi:predicted transposase YdaD
MPNDPSPHDPFVKTVFADLAHAADELRAVLPPALVARIDWRTLKREPGSFVDEALRSRHTDMLFSMRTKGGAELRVYVLFEHQSQPDHWMVLRVLEYTVRIWSDFRARNPGARHLPVVIPIVLHHGEGGWSAPRELHELLDPLVREVPEVAALVPQARLLVDDLAAMDDDALEARSRELALRVALWLLRDGRSRERLLASLARWGPVLLELLARPGSLRSYAYQLVYLFRVADDDVRVAFHELLDHTSPEASETAMTIAETLINEGIAKGLAKGRDEGRDEGRIEGRVEAGVRSVLRVLAKRGLEVPDQVRQRIEACADPEELEGLHERALEIARADELFAN